MIIKPLVVDIYHGNSVGKSKDEVGGFEAAKGAGIIGFIHKASQGTGMTDSAYARRRLMCKNVGLLWGAYHFNSGQKVTAQVEHFFNVARPDDHTLMALDFEDNLKSQMTIEQAREFLELADIKLGRKLAIYSGNRLKELLPRKDAFFGSHRLWLAQYGPRPKLPKSWPEYWLWQYAADGEGPLPHKIPGIPGNPDVNTSRRTVAQLTAEWPG